MRILTVVKKLGPGGTERSAENGARLYRRHGHESAVLATREGGPRAAALDAAGVVVFIGGAGDLGGEAVERAVAWRPDLVHIHREGLREPESAALLRRFLSGDGRRVPVVETNHFARVDRSSDRLLIDVHLQLSRWCLWKWTAWARGLAPVPLGVVMPHLVDTEVFFPASAGDVAAWRSEHGVPDGAFVFGRIGQRNMPSWSPLAIKAFARVAARRDEVRLVLIGLPEALRGTIDRLPPAIRARVITPPFAHGDDRLRVCYSAIDCFLHASSCGESFGFVLVESMLCGTPVITLSTPTRGNSQLEVVGHERGGLVVNDRQTMQEAMTRLMDDAELRGRLAAQGRRHVLDEYAMDRLGPRLLELIELTAGSRDRDRLRSALDEHGFTTRVETEEIRGLLRRSMGRVSLTSRAILHATHVPAVHGTVVALKNLMRRLGS